MAVLTARTAAADAAWSDVLREITSEIEEQVSTELLVREAQYAQNELAIFTSHIQNEELEDARQIIQEAAVIVARNDDSGLIASVDSASFGIDEVVADQTLSVTLNVNKLPAIEGLIEFEAAIQVLKIPLN